MEKNNIIILIVSALIIILSMSVVYFLVMPAYADVGIKSEQIIQLKSQIEAKRNYNTSVDSQSKALEELGWSEKKKSIEVNFTSTPFYIPKMNVFFQTMAQSSGMILSNVTSAPAVSTKKAAENTGTSESKSKETSSSAQSQVVQQSETTYLDQLKGPINKISFNISVTGTYNAFKRFLSDLEAQTRIVTVKSITVSSSQEGSGRRLVNTSQFNLVVDTYSY